MKYVSTRGTAPRLDFEDAALTGLARDGGLYVPESWPTLSHDQIASFAGKPYAEVAADVIAPFMGHAMPSGDLREILARAYAPFRHPATAPLVQTGPNDFILELFHGPTLAFKDFAMQVLAPLMERALTRRGDRAAIIAATSGDTGGAAVEAFRERARIDLFVLHPEGRTSEVQRKQMTTVDAANVHNIAVRGNFDDAQAIVKALFNDHGFRDRHRLAAVNSINWARIMAQVVYYFTAAVSLGAPYRPVSFTVPTGNFGDIFAGYVAKQMGLPIDRLVIASNVNDILTRTLETGRYERGAVMPSSSPSMDIQVSSNFERLLFEMSGRDADLVRTQMDTLQQSGGFTLEPAQYDGLKELFAAARADEDETMNAIRVLYNATGYVADPHTAVGLHAACLCRGDDSVPMITLATAHPAKFPDAIRAAIGVSPELPETLRARLSAPEHYDVLDSDQAQIADYIAARTTDRAGLPA
ncbi:threonine synthase [Dichotomicrobium thermohalophilum]|uniref:Threonine synthase n=1 Tax=Dichotomicrobium thermohalophilum TaxID=933063 RepID=A0A397Q5K5_9HYPH|nr:threonine synthase [Dichotomicrobium thermohalophilum]RIA56382.1 threonine synthase [Dichotomicrobium thermohalophilum]